MKVDSLEYLGLTVGEPQMPAPAIAGKVAGIISERPFTLQCNDCGTTVAATERDRPLGPALVVLLSGFHFHRCEGKEGVRRCPDCLAKVEAACDRRHS